MPDASGDAAAASSGLDASKGATGDDAGARAEGDAAPGDTGAEGLDGQSPTRQRAGTGPSRAARSARSSRAERPPGPTAGRGSRALGHPDSCRQAPSRARSSSAPRGDRLRRGRELVHERLCRRDGDRLPGRRDLPGLINAHDHTEYATRGPRSRHGTTRWEHRNDWRTGADGEPKPCRTSSNTTDDPTIAAEELRFVLGGATTVVGSGGVGGLMRNLADYPEHARTSKVSPEPGVLRHVPARRFERHRSSPSGCAYPKTADGEPAFAGRRATRRTSPRASTSRPRTSSPAPAGSHDLLTAQDLDHPRRRDRRDRRRRIAAAGAKLIWSPRIEHRPLRQHRAGHGLQGASASRSRSAPTGSRRAR